MTAAGTTRHRILVVAMADSVHTARWLAQFRDDPIDVELFPSTPHRRLHPLIREMRNGLGPMRLRVSPVMSWGALPAGLFDLLTRNRLRTAILRRRITRWNPHMIHAMETQHAGYLLNLLRSAAARPITLTVWGSDFNWYGRRASHLWRIRTLLERISHLIVECDRDARFARMHGYRGQSVTRIPASGGLEDIRPTSSASTRDVVLVKGYSGFMGMGPSAIDALERSADLLEGMEIVVFSAGLRTRVYAIRARRRSGLQIRCIPKHGLNQEAMLGLMVKSRMLIALSRSDGFPGVVREALLSGVFVIHSDTACLTDWVPRLDLIRLVDVTSPASVRAGVRRSIQAALDDRVVDEAGEVLQCHARATWSVDALRPVITGLYARLIDGR